MVLMLITYIPFLTEIPFKFFGFYEGDQSENLRTTKKIEDKKSLLMEDQLCKLINLFL